MKLIFMITIVTLLEIFQLVKVKRSQSHSKSKNKKQYYYTSNPVYTYAANSPLYQSYNDRTSSYTYINPSDLRTPLTTGTFSRGGVLYQTNAPDIPYGTGYSYGPWKKIPM